MDVRCAGPQYDLDVRDRSMIQMKQGQVAGYLDTVMDLRSAQNAEKFWTN